MKKALDKSQVLTLGATIAVVLVAGGLAWFGLGAIGEKQAEAEVLAERMAHPALAALLNSPGGANRAQKDASQIQKLEKEFREKDAVMARWSEATKELTGQGKDWAKDPGKWKDRLIAVQSNLQREAKAGRVELAPDFYLGLDSFRQKSPTVEEVPALALHLSVAERLVRCLIAARKVKEQYPTACALRSFSGPGTGPEKGSNPEKTNAGAKGKTAGVAQEIERKKFRMEIRSSPEVLYELAQTLVKDSALFILTDLRVVSEKQSFPLRSEIAKKFSQPTPGGGGEAAGEKRDEKKLLEILAGEEALNATLELDFLPWTNPEEVKVGGKGATATP